MPPFHRPGPTPVRRSAVPARVEAEIARKREAFAKAEGLFRQPITKAMPPTSAGRTSHLSSFSSGLDTMGRLAASIPAQKAEPEPLHPRAKALASRCGPRGAAVLSAIAKRSDEERGQPIEVTPADVAGLIGVDVPSATTLLNDLRASGLLLPRNNPLGFLAGYILPSA